METSQSAEIYSLPPTRWLYFLLALMLIPAFLTAPYVLLDTDTPPGEVEAVSIASQNEGFLLVILDGVGRELMLDAQSMPNLNQHKQTAAVLNIQTGPLTLSATCISELMTGVPNRPIDGLNNFNLGHPGGNDPWTLAGEDERYSVGMVGSYVMGNIYDGMPNINFVDTFKGHSDYYEGDEETEVIATQWLENGEHNVIAAHFSGPDKVGHHWGIRTDEYRAKLLSIDLIVERILQSVPSDWTVVITADHGMTDAGTHGSAEKVTQEVAAIISGPHVKTGEWFDIKQPDIAAFMTSTLLLDFPNQLQGRIPLAMLAHTPSELTALEQWNWEAGYNRHVFYYPEDKDTLSESVVEWQAIETEAIQVRTVDVIASTLTLLALLAGVAYVFGGKKIIQKEELMKIGGVGLFAFVLVYFQANLAYSAMIPRGLGALGAVWLVGSALGRAPSNPIQWKKFEPVFWGSVGFVVIALTIIQGTLTQSLVQSAMFALFALSVFVFTGHWRDDKKERNYIFILLAVTLISIGGLRLWFFLIPWYYILGGILLEKDTERTKESMVPLLSTFALTFLAIVLVHRRVFGRHYMLDLVNLSATSLGGFLLTGLLILWMLLAVKHTVLPKDEHRASTYFGIALALGVVVREAAFDPLEKLMLLAVLAGYGLAIRQAFSDKTGESSRMHIVHAVALHTLISWGIWAACCITVLLTSMPKIITTLKKWTGLERMQSSQQWLWLFYAMIPWLMWLLWWTLYGQVNGIQTCFEGICPHPRELDPGAVAVQGGYFAAGDTPSTAWMVFMIASPLLVASSVMMMFIQEQDIPLMPFILTQSALILGCLCLYAYSPTYPRLIFMLTWQAFFALVQIFSASVAMLLQNLKTQFLKPSQIALN